MPTRVEALGGRRRPMFAGRRVECAALDRLVGALRAGESRVLVVRGEPGAGKTALLEQVAERATGCRVVRVSGVQSEVELVFAGLHQLCAPLLGRAGRLPVPQREALRTAFGLSSGPAPDRFLIGLGVLGLLSDAAEERPLLCLVDDQQWLDRASKQVLAFVARRLGAESVGLVFGVRRPGDELAGLPELVVGGLPDADARALLAAVLPAPLDSRVRDQIVAETRGNPLALLEVPRGLTPVELAGGFGLPDLVLPSGGVEGSLRRRIADLPEDTRRLLVVAAADPTGDPALVWRAAARLGIAADAAGPAAEADLAEFGVRVRFRHPLVRSVAYRSASHSQRRDVHRALAAATDAAADPDRRAWHRAKAAAGPDEDVAGELERSADRARARGGAAAAAAFLGRAATLTVDPVRRAGRALAAAEAETQAGAFGVALDRLTLAESGPLDELQQARAELLRAQLAFVANRGRDAPPLLLTAARRLEPIDAGRSAATYLEALSAAMFSGRLAEPGGDSAAVAGAAGMASRPVQAPTVRDRLLAGLAGLFTDGYVASLPALRRALAAFGAGVPADEQLPCLWLANAVALQVWDDELWDTLSGRYVDLARQSGALRELPLALSMRAHFLLFAGELPAAASMVDEVAAAAEATGCRLAPYGAMSLAALRGCAAEAQVLIETAAADSQARGEGIGLSSAELATALLGNGLGRYPEAMAAAGQAAAHTHDLGTANWATVELVEAAERAGRRDVAVDAHRGLAGVTGATGTEWALGVAARAGALLAGADAERLHQESITRLGRTRMRTELARAHLLYGEWLRRERRRTDAREQLRTAHDMLEAMGMAAFAERAGRELAATGGTAPKRTAPRANGLTAQETQIARLARDGLSNPEIGSRLYLSSRTVQYHLHKVFTKLGISSRRQLGHVLP
ncbi:helix-turn-helix transcriptional regulator [Amycolatopsis thermophila]|uniref:DNA-binding CsgD family transcriptional regulator n=1 Tax=Amycolatopsis thermophila TaxID=206084 RepID=A0ABU0F6J7_9PSEU|nr:helix-turn-helix transcriptional regulator [Amycolatopsis thermophila]MDQ0383018.1 DNA-binding CsgD family transcriptional regulator [Amycolatopsis thermophila]